MNYAIVKNGIIVNTIVIDDERYVSVLGALPLSEDQKIGDSYITPVKSAPTDFLREIVDHI